MQLRVKVVSGHRFAELPIRMADGTKVHVGKEEFTVLDTDDLAQGEEFTIRRYETENRFIVEAVTRAEEPVASFVCGAPTASGGVCQRPVASEGERCYQHGVAVVSEA